MKSAILKTAIAIGLVIPVSSAFAGKQVYPASMCVKWTDKDVTPHLSSSRIYNTSSSRDMRVDCPILHQNFNAKSGNNLDDADIGLIDGSTRADARCWLASRYQSGSALYGSSGGTRTTTGWGNHEQNRDFDGTGRHVDNWYYIGCNIPRADSGRWSGITYYSAQD